jgi:hypothetical protein
MDEDEDDTIILTAEDIKKVLETDQEAEKQAEDDESS